MEPKRTTDPELLNIQEELIKLEPIFHHPELGTTRNDYENMTDPDFWEVGASGNRYSREFAIETLVDRYNRAYDDDWETKDFYCQQLAQDTYLLTYTLIQGGTKVTRRSTIWKRALQAWKIYYHQGTIVQDSVKDK